MIYLIGSIIAFSLIIIIHEGGHFLVAKFVGMKVNEFSLGMGPKIYSFQKGETLYSVRLLPIGGFVRPEGEDEESDDPRAFNNKSLKARAAVVAAGPISNFILSFGIIILLITFVGVPMITIGGLVENSPAYESGLEPGDEIKIVNGKNIYIFEDLIKSINVSKNQTVDMTVIRDGEELLFSIPTMYSEETQRNIIGIYPGQSMNFHSFSISENFTHSINYSTTLFRQLGLWFKRLITGQMTKDEIGGPVKIITITGEVAKLGIYPFIHFIALLSLSLGIFNLFPIPALDGGRLVFFAIEGIRGKPIDQEKEAMIHFIGFALLILLMIVITYNDIKDLIMFRVSQ